MRHVSALCQFYIVMFIENQNESHFPHLPSGDPYNAAALLYMEWEEASPSASFLIISGRWHGHQVRDTCSNL